MVILLMLTCSVLLVLMAKSPFIMSLGLVAFSLVLSLILHGLGLVWVTYTLVIMFLGGMMIVFIYASSMNSVFKLSMKTYKMLSFLSVMVILFTILPSNLFSTSHSYFTPVWLNFCCSGSGVLCLMALLILMTLFIVVKLVQVTEGPLKF